MLMCLNLDRVSMIDDVPSYLGSIISHHMVFVAITRQRLQHSAEAGHPKAGQSHMHILIDEPKKRVNLLTFSMP